MHEEDILILKGNEIKAILTGLEKELMEAVRMAYEAHFAGNTSLPHSTFLLFPNNPRSRIIALPALLEHEEVGGAGVKWISSFPDNIDKGLDRASAVMILNSLQTGRPKAIFEGSIISAKRTAASAALAAKHLQTGKKTVSAGIVGCGLINFEVVKFLSTIFPEMQSLLVFDLDPARSLQFKNRCQKVLPEIRIDIADRVETLISSTSLVSFATTSARPYINSLASCRPGTTILHISLRDLSPEIILSSDNIVDDIDHVCRAQTSVHLAEQLVGNRDFIRSTLAEITLNKAVARKDDSSIAVFSPFGLGILDIAVANLVYKIAAKRELGTVFQKFLPDSWIEE